MAWYERLGYQTEQDAMAQMLPVIKQVTEEAARTLITVSTQVIVGEKQILDSLDGWHLDISVTLRRPK